MFKFVSLALLALALQSASARPQQSDSTTPIAIVSQTQSIDGSGNFNYAFESADGVKEEGSGSLKTLKVPKIDPQTGATVGEEDGQGIVQQGKYSYTAPDGQLIEVTYIADENGFQPQGSHLPVAPVDPANPTPVAPAPAPPSS